MGAALSLKPGSARCFLERDDKDICQELPNGLALHVDGSDKENTQG